MRGAGRLVALCLGAGLATTLAAAESAVFGHMAGLGPCLAAAPTRALALECSGPGRMACEAAAPEGATTAVRVRCALAEFYAWDARMAAEHEAVLAAARAADARDAPAFAVRARNLAAAQEAFLLFRDETCGRDSALWGSGSFRLVAKAECFVAATAERTLDLRDYRALLDGGDP